MSDIFERAKQHFASKPREFIEVPEWGDGSGPARIYWSPWRITELDVISNASKATGKDVELFCRTVIMKAEDEAGNKLFNKDQLFGGFDNHIDPEVIIRIGKKMLGDILSLEQAEKNF